MVGRTMCGILVVTGVLSGCNPASDGGQERPCEECAPWTGGETSDFGGLGSSCTGEQIAFSRAEEFGLDAEQVRADAEGDWRTAFAWTLPTASPESSALTELQAELVLSEPGLFLGVDDYNGQVNPGCPSFLRFPTELEFSLRDGSLAARVQGELTAATDRAGWIFFSDTNLSDALGNLDLELSPEHRYAGRLQIHVYGTPTGRRGQILPVVADLDEPPPHAETSFNWLTVNLGRFPVDACTADTFPFDGTEPQPWLDGDSFARTWSDVTTRAAYLPGAAVWLDDNLTEVRFVPGEFSNTCAKLFTDRAEFTFATSSRVESSDQRLKSQIQVARLTYSEQAASSMSLETSAMSLSKSGVEQLIGVRLLDTAEQAPFEVRFQAQYGFASASANGYLTVKTPGCDGVLNERCDHGKTGSWQIVEALNWPIVEDEAPAASGDGE